MEPDLEHDIRHLAYHIWQTAGRDFSQTVLDFWAMAERESLKFQTAQNDRSHEGVFRQDDFRLEIDEFR